MSALQTTPPPAAASTADFRVAAQDGAPQQFALEGRDGFTPAAEEKRYLDQLASTLASLCTLSQEPAIAARQTPIRDRALAVLRKAAMGFAALPPGAARLAEAQRLERECLRTEGRYREWYLRISTTPFIVTPVDADGQPIDLRGRTRIYNVDLLTRDVAISPAQQALKTSLDVALGVVKVVFAERETRAANTWWFSEAAIEALRLRRHDYVLQLYGIATVGLTNVDPSQAPFAQADLDRFRSEFRDREAGLVKNDYLWRLGAWCLLALLVSAAAYIGAKGGWLGPVAFELRNFALLTCGAALGTWLSFSLRREVLSFEDLAVLERDQLDPSTRVLFITGLVLVAGLLFWSRAITVGIGDFGTYEAMHLHGSWALLAGLLAGIAERALATVVSKRAGDFAGAIGGKTGS